MSKNLKEILRLHKLWIDGKEGGQRAILRGADLRNADLRGADLRDAEIDLKIEDGLINKIAKSALSKEGALDMSCWHSCETTHCIAGWACVLAKDGAAIEAEYGAEVAGLLLLGVEAHSYFFKSNDEAKEYLSKFL